MLRATEWAVWVLAFGKCTSDRVNLSQPADRQQQRLQRHDHGDRASNDSSFQPADPQHEPLQRQDSEAFGTDDICSQPADRCNERLQRHGIAKHGPEHGPKTAFQDHAPLWFVRNQGVL